MITFSGCLPSLPNPISPNFSSHFALCHLAPYPFCPLPFCPFAVSPNHLFAHLPFHPLRICPNAISPFIISPFTTLAYAILPIYHHAPLSFHHSVSVSLKLLTTSHNFLLLEPKHLPGTR